MAQLKKRGQHRDNNCYHCFGYVNPIIAHTATSCIDCSYTASDPDRHYPIKGNGYDILPISIDILMAIITI